MALPPGWVVAVSEEHVPDPNEGEVAYGTPGFMRITYTCTDENGQYVCASGAESDCYAQAQAMAESRTQHQPYNQAA